jgi:hypothetical protein
MNIDRRVLQLMARYGSDFSKIHRFNFYLYFPTEEGARLARGVLEREGFEVDLCPPDRITPDWPSKMLPEEAELLELRHWFERLAADLGGDYDGWEAGVEV